MCACLRRLRYCTNKFSPGVNRCQKSKVWYYDTPKYPVHVLKDPQKGYHNNVQVPTLFDKLYPLCVVRYQIIWVPEPLLLCAYYPKSWICTGNYLGSRAAAYQLLRIAEWACDGIFSVAVWFQNQDQNEDQFSIPCQRLHGSFYNVFEKSKNELVWPKMMFSVILLKIWWFSDNSDTLANSCLTSVELCM